MFDYDRVCGLLVDRLVKIRFVHDHYDFFFLYSFVYFGLIYQETSAKPLLMDVDFLKILH